MTRYHMRRADREITEVPEIDSILARGRYVTFALVDDGAPYVVTLSYGYDPAVRRMYFHVAHEGRKLDIISRDPRATGTVVVDHGYRQGACAHPFESVVIEGTFRIAHAEDEKRHAIETLVRHLEDEPDAYWDSRLWSLDDRITGFTALVFEIETMSAKRGS